jgi:hypothetical protein
MARGDSGKIVLEIEPAEKEKLYSAVKRDGLTMKDWFLQQMASYLDRSVVAERRAAYGGGKSLGAGSAKKGGTTKKKRGAR